MADLSPSTSGTASPSDETLLAQFADTRDAEAFARLVGRHLARVRGSARRLCPDPATADDIAQAVFILLARRAEDLSRRSLLGPTGYVAGFLHRATVLTALDIRRSERRRLRRERNAARPESARTTAVELPVEVDTALNSLGEKDRDVLLYRYWQGLSPDETAAQLGISPAAVAKRLTRALARLRKQLALPTASAGAAIPPELLLQTHPESALPATESYVVETVRMSLPHTPSALSALPPTALIAARALHRFALLGTARTAAYVVAALLVALTPVLAASSLLRPAANSETALLAVASSAPSLPAVELPPDSLQGEALVDWLIARNEKAVEKYKAVRYTVEHRQTFLKQPERLLRASVLLDYPRYRVDASANANRIRLGSATIVAGPDIAVLNPREYISYSHEVRTVRIMELPPGGTIHPGEQPFFLPTVITTVLRSTGSGSESLRATRARLEAKGQKLVATRSVDPDTGMVRFVLTYRPSRERLSETQVVLDPARDYLVCAATSGGADLGFYSRYRIDFTTVRGLHLPTRIELVQTDKDQRVIQTQVSTFNNFSVGAPFSEADFTIAGIPIPNGASRVFTTMDGLTDREVLFYSDGKWVNRQDYRRLHPAPATAPAK
jgi:RNA polymerase sigma factor (sigma-70 family)